MFDDLLFLKILIHIKIPSNEQFLLKTNKLLMFNNFITPILYFFSKKIDSCQILMSKNNSKLF